MKTARLQYEQLLKLNLECYDSYMALPYEEREKTEYDEYHAKFLVSRGVVVQETARWFLEDGKGNGTCSNCNRQDKIDPLATHCRYCGARFLR